MIEEPELTIIYESIRKNYYCKNNKITKDDLCTIFVLDFIEYIFILIIPITIKFLLKFYKNKISELSKHSIKV